MINFNWERFKNGKIEVHCDTEEKANDFLKECDKKGIKWISGKETVNLNNWDDEREDTIYCCFNRNSKLEYAELSYIYRSGKKIKIIKWNLDNLEKTFREVNADIKEGEVWESLFAIISCDNFGIEIKFKDREYSKYYFCDDVKFKLQRKEYIFEEAFKSLKEGKEIESVITGDKMKKLPDGTFGVVKKTGEILTEKEGEVAITLQEIESKWYIND